MQGYLHHLSALEVKAADEQGAVGMDAHGRSPWLREVPPSPDNVYVIQVHQFAPVSGSICNTFTGRSRYSEGVWP